MDPDPGNWMEQIGEIANKTHDGSMALEYSQLQIGCKKNMEQM